MRHLFNRPWTKCSGSGKVHLISSFFTRVHHMLHVRVELGLCFLLFCIFCLCCMQSSNPLLRLDTAQYRHSCHFSQVTLLPLSLSPAPPPPSLFPSHPLPPQNLFLISSCFLPPPLLALPFLFFHTLPPPHSAFDDLSQAHAGEYNKAGYGGAAQSQAKSAGSGPGKGTCTTHGAHTQLVGVFQ